MHRPLSFSLIDSDGISIYSNCEDKFEVSTIGALTSGLWQAAESLSAIVGKNNDFFEFRLGFDTSSDGLYILPVKIINEMYFVCIIYGKSENPGKLKRNIRQLKDSLEVFLSKFSLDVEKNREEYLFQNISDVEMDKLFAYGGI